jgi:hypothetical protein
LVRVIGVDGIRDTMAALRLMEEPALTEDFAEDNDELKRPEVAPELVTRVGGRRSRADGGVGHRGSDTMKTR